MILAGQVLPLICALGTLALLAAPTLEQRVWKLEEQQRWVARERDAEAAFRKVLLDKQLDLVTLELKRVAEQSEDNKHLLRDGSLNQMSILARLVKNEGNIHRLQSLDEDHKEEALRTRQLMWGLGLSLLGHLVVAGWAFVKWWVNKDKNLTGAAGPPGPAGATGATGPAGPTGGSP